MRLKLLCLNLEGHKHFDIQKEFFKKEDADVLCLQEIFEQDFEELKRALHMSGIFAPMSSHQHYAGAADEVWHNRGNAILSTLPIHNVQKQYYWGSEEEITHFDRSEGMNQDDMSKVLLSCFVGEKSSAICIGTTHFTWTPDGKPDAFQEKDIEFFMKSLADHKEIVFCGDFNAPRGLATFERIASTYRDNIPKEYTCSLDLERHKAPEAVKEYMVDGLFSTPNINVSDVRMIEGVSDHKAIIATIEKSKAVQ